MDWARSRRLTVIGVLIVAVLAILLIIGFAIFYKTPTCTDSKMNGDETGIDCGGSCSTVCRAEAQTASVRFARVLQQSGRNDLIAYIDNPNVNAYAARADLLIDIYRQDGRQLQKHAYVSLPANMATPLFIPNIANAAVQQIFVSFASSSPVWMKGSGGAEAMPKASNIVVTGTGDHPNVTATVTNPIAYPEHNVPFIVTVFANDGTVIAASQTVVPLIPAQGNAQAVFTWNEPFVEPYARIEIVPILALPTVTP
ncbi:MAG TPA: hypothetical protein VN086_02095 [Candidatus Paceibacterota bacterium]|nr:hypothetical protein [Candidatus Paceibacterota bacterium]